jgi:hypothetical protein
MQTQSNKGSQRNMSCKLNKTCMILAVGFRLSCVAMRRTTQNQGVPEVRTQSNKGSQRNTSCKVNKTCMILAVGFRLSFVAMRRTTQNQAVPEVQTQSKKGSDSIKPTSTGTCPKKRPFSRGYTSLQLAVRSPERERLNDVGESSKTLRWSVTPPFFYYEPGALVSNQSGSTPDRSLFYTPRTSSLSCRVP